MLAIVSEVPLGYGSPKTGSGMEGTQEAVSLQHESEVVSSHHSSGVGNKAGGTAHTAQIPMLAAVR